MAQATVSALLDECQTALASMLLASIRSNQPRDAGDQTLGEKRAKRFQAEARAVALLRLAGPPAPAPPPAAQAEAGPHDDPAPDAESDAEFDAEFPADLTDGDAQGAAPANDNEGTTVDDGQGFDVAGAPLAEVQAETRRRLADFRRELEVRGLAGDAERGVPASGDAVLGAAGRLAGDWARRSAAC